MSTANRKAYFTTYRFLNKEKLNEASKLAMKNRRARKNKKIRVRCVCCNSSFWAERKDAKYCDKCKPIVSHVEIKAIRSKLTVDDSIAVSDFIFKNDKCDNDCFNCKFTDCILEVDDEM